MAEIWEFGTGEMKKPSLRVCHQNKRIYAIKNQFSEVVKPLAV
jgi:hypothetical protein